jgi:tetratricopeptide (TPR) repeat protein
MLVYLNDAIAACDAALRNGTDVSPICRTIAQMMQSIGRFSESVQWQTRAMQSQPDRVELFSSLGCLYAEQRQWSEAIAAYQQALQLNPTHAASCWSLANIYAELEQPSEEIRYREQAIRLNSAWATPVQQFYLGNRLLTEQRSEEAVLYYQQAIAKAPDFFEAHYNLAVSLVQQEAVQEAAVMFQRALELDSQDASSYYGLGRIAQHQANWMAAKTYYSRVIELDAHHKSAFAGLGEVCLKLCEWENSVNACERAMALGDNSAWVYHNLGYGQLKLGQTAEAMTWLYRAVKAEPQSPWFRLHLGEALLQQGQWHQAVTALLGAIQLQPDLPNVYGALGLALKRLKKSDPQTVHYTAETIPLNPKNRRVAFMAEIAQQLLAHCHPEAALLFYQLGLELEPKNQELQQQLQQAQLQLRELNQAIATHYWAIQQTEAAEQSYTQLAHLLADQGGQNSAIALHRKALELKGWRQAVEREYCFTRDWFTHNISSWTQHLQPLMQQPGLQALEIGCFEGMATCWLLDHVLTDAQAHITCVDLYPQDALKENLKRTKATEKVKVMVGNSHQVLPNLQPEFYDLIYVSGCPIAAHIQEDGKLAWTLLKPGGLIIFDYYGWIDQDVLGQESRVGIDAFLAAVQPQVERLHQEYQVIARKIG